jgi:hypothetical protein
MNYNTYRRFMKNKYALSTVVTTLIILVVSILLASVLTYFAVNVVSTRVQEESLHVTKQHVWVDTDGAASEAAVMVTNNGGRDVVINKISIRGQASGWGDVFYRVADDDDDLTADLTYITTPVAAGDFTAASTALILASGETMIIYVNDPDSISLNDIGLTVSISLGTAQATYYSEMNVQASPAA